MSYLENTTLIVDAILTKRGRELFSKGQFNITKFALSDDEVDYRLWNTAHPSGSSYYGAAIENLPILQALPDGSQVMRNKLVSLPKGSQIMPQISVGVTKYWLKTATTINSAESITITPTTSGGLNSTVGYTVTVFDPTVITLSSNTGQATSSSPGASITGTAFTLTANTLSYGVTSKTTYISISGNEGGIPITVPVVVYNPQVTNSEDV